MKTIVRYPLRRRRPSRRTIISYTRMPRVHQSTADVWPELLITSGAMYSVAGCWVKYDHVHVSSVSPSVPTNEFARTPTVQDRVSTTGIYNNSEGDAHESSRRELAHPILDLHHSCRKPSGLLRLFGKVKV